MVDLLNRGWRIFATGFCFCVFGLAGIGMAFLAHPLICLRYRSPERRALAAKAAIHHILRAMVRLMSAVGVVSYEVHGRERLRRSGLLVIANHPSLIDAVFLIALIEQADCIVKGSLSHNPFVRGPIRAAGYICNDSGPRMVEDCIHSVRSGNNLIVFPEGTRTPLDRLVKLRRGAGNIAVRGGIDLTPVRIRSTRPMLTKGKKWYHVPVCKPHFILEVGEDIPVQRFLDEKISKTLAARKLTEFLANYFFMESPHVEP